jgi:ferredoxin-type protein NapH
VTRSSSLSRPARWRIVSLLVVHLLIAAHIIHWRLAGTTLTSIQLSDAGRFVAEGVATAALILFSLLFVITVVFGRVFCAWGCHMLALQEACRLLLARLGIRHKLIRSRFLLLVPLFAAFSIYVRPLAERWWLGRPFPSTTLQLTSGNLWASLPGPVEAVAAVLVGGLLMVYLLGSLSFCKYVCPYGAVFALADNLALGRMRLIGECDGCARCTAACTTDVRVHEEVLRLGMVASSGCMRCFECVSACPRGVLAYRFGRPALLAGSRAGLTPYAFALGEECLMLVLFTTSFVALHGLYDALPLLLSLAASVVVAYLGVLTARLLREPFVALRGIALRQSAHLSRAGVLFICGVGLLSALLGHSLLIQYHQWRAVTALDALEFPRVRAVRSSAERETASSAAAHLLFCSRYGLIDTFDTNMKLAWVYRLLAQPHMVEEHLRRAIALDPTQPAAHFNLGKELAREGRHAEAAHAFGEAVRLAPTLAQYVRE